MSDLPLKTASARLRPAIFLDRDGTVIVNAHYLGDPGLVQPFPEAGPALRRFRKAGYALVIVTNQSAIGRGLITHDQYLAVTAEMERQFALEGVIFDGIYHCHEVPATSDRTAVEHGDRKPGPGMLLRAARELGLDLGSSWMIGDMISDVLAGFNAGCQGTILLAPPNHAGKGQGTASDVGQRVADNLMSAADIILEERSS